jgi:putative transposase
MRQLRQGGYRSCLLDESHLWNALCYVEQNPVRAGMTSCSWEWRWSSAAALIGIVPSDIPLDCSLWKERHDPETWRKVLELGLSEAVRLRQATDARSSAPAASCLSGNLELRFSRSVRPQRRRRKPRPAVPKEGPPNCAME